MIKKLLIILMLATVLVITSLPVFAAPAEDLTAYPGEEEPPPEPALYLNGVELWIPDDGIVKLGGSDINNISTANGKVNCSININGDGEWNLNGDLAITGSITVIKGTLNTNSYKVDADSIYGGEYGTALKVKFHFGNSVINVFTLAARGDNVQINPSASTINATLIFDNRLKSGHNYYNVNISDREIVTVVPDRYEWVNTVVSDGMGGTRIVPVWTLIEPAHEIRNTVYGFVEGISKFHNLIINGNVYVNDNLEASACIISKGKIISNKTWQKPDNIVTIMTDTQVITVEANKEPVIVAR